MVKIEDFDCGENIPESVFDPNALCVPLSMAELSLDVGPRPWIYGSRLMRGMLSVLGGPGGAGKTHFALKVGLSIVTGRYLLSTAAHPEHYLYVPHAAVWYLTLEDPIDEVKRNLKAEVLHNHLHPREVRNFFVSSGRDAPLCIARQQQNGTERLPIDAIVKHIQERNIALVIVDPFANSFEGSDVENAADAMKVVLDQWRLIAHRADCAIWLLHHFRKGGVAGDSDAFRGSGVVQNAARVMETLTKMTKDQADPLGIDMRDRRSFVRLENAKANLAAGPDDGTWYRFLPVKLGNGTRDYPEGDSIGLLTPWQPVVAALPWATLEQVLAIIGAGTGDGEFYSSHPQSTRWAGAVIRDHLRNSHAQAGALLAKWIAAGVLTKDKYSSTKSRRSTERLVVAADAVARLKDLTNGGGGARL